MNKFKKILQSTTTKVISLLLIVLFGLSLYFCADFYERQLNKIKGCYWIYQGDKAFKKENLQNAINCYQKGIKLFPAHYRALYNLANIYVVYEDYYAALENYEKALKIKPDFEIARIDYAIILTETYNTDEAIKQYDKVINNKQSTYVVPFLSQNNRFKRITIPLLYDRKEAYKHNIGVAYYNRGLAYRTKSLLAGIDVNTSTKYLNKASDSYKKATEVLNSYNANYNLGLIHQLLKEKTQAGYYYCKAIASAPMEYEAHFNLAVLLNDMGKIKESAQEFSRAGLILDSQGENLKTKYIYNVLDEVNKKIALSDQEKKDKQDIKDKLMGQTKNAKKYKHSEPVYKAGKLVLDTSDDNKELMESFKTCSAKELFMGDEELK